RLIRPMRADKIRAMDQTSFFLEFFSKVPDGTTELRYAPGARVFRQDQLGDAAFVVCSGKVGIFREQDSGRELIAMRGPGHLVGEMALFGQKRRSASLVALEESILLRIEAERVMQLMAEQPALGAALSRALAVRLQELMDQNLEEKNRELDRR